MKKITILLATLVTTGLFAQNNDTTKVEIGNLKIIVNGDDVKIFSDTVGKGITISTTDNEYDYNANENSSNNDYDYNEGGRNENAEGDTVRISIGKKLLTITDNGIKYNSQKTAEELEKDANKEKKHELTHWAGIDLGINGYMVPEYNLDLGKKNNYLELDYAKSRVISFNLKEYKIRIAKDYFGLATGFGIQYNNYILNNKSLLQFGNDTITTYSDTTIKDLSKNKLRATYLRIPLLLEFNTSENYKKSFHLAAGVVGGVNIGSMYKIKYTRDDKDQKDKSKGLKVFNPFQLDAMVRFGYGEFTLFGTVGLLPLFQENDGPELNTFSAGIAFNI
jgi:Outer membrane protein beta-barrel domain